jgi:hypothetical protein
LASTACTDQELDHAARRVELAALLALGARELRQEVLVHAAKDVLGARLLVADPDVADEVDELPEPRLVQRRPRVVLRQHALQRGVVPLDAFHRIVHEPSDGGLPRLRLEVRPARLRRHPEDVLGAVLVRVLRVGAAALLRDELRVCLLEGVGDVLQEDQAEDDVLVLGGVHAAAEGIGHLPELGFVADGGGAGILRLRLSLRHVVSSAVY